MKYLRFLLGLITAAIIMFAATVAGIICIPQNVFDSNYTSLIQEKFEILKNTNEPKIIMVAGSSSAFGLNQDMLEEKTGYKVANLGLHAGFGHLFVSELAKQGINPGDIVLLGYEYDWQVKYGFTRVGADLIMSGIDDNIGMYRYLPPEILKKCLGYLFTYASQKRNYTPATGIYSREAFDPATGQMTMERDYSIEYNKETHGVVDISNVKISKDSVKYLKEFKKFIEDRGAVVYFVSPPLLEDCIVCDYSEFTKLKELEEEQIGIEYISDPLEYIYPSKYISNSNYHCNSVGADIRTEMLIKDLRDASVIE